MHPKVKAAGLGGALVTLLVAFLGAIGVSVPADVSAALVAVASWGAGFVKTAA
jgi:hypothetical protein